MTTLLLSTGSSRAKADPLTCDKVLKLCDQALQDERKLTHAQDILIKAQDDLSRTQLDRITQLETKQNNILRSPYLWGIMGLIGGFLIAK